jgi:O-antigen/teichoic acid export membrane protein
MSTATLVRRACDAAGRLYRRGSFGAHVLTPLSGTAAAQAIPLLLAPLITRLYEPEDFGVFALYAGVSTIVTGLATARYDLAIVLPERDEDAIGLVLGALLVALALSAATALALLLTANVPMPAKLGGIRQYLWILPAAVMGTGVAQVFQYWARRCGAYLRLSSSRVASGVGSPAGQVTLGALGLGAWGLVIGSFLGQVAATGALLVGVSMEGAGSALRGRGPVLGNLRRYADGCGPTSATSA